MFRTCFPKIKIFLKALQSDFMLLDTSQKMSFRKAVMILKRRLSEISTTSPILVKTKIIALTKLISNFIIDKRIIDYTIGIAFWEVSGLMGWSWSRAN
jgi:hypothetical protein